MSKTTKSQSPSKNARKNSLLQGKAEKHIQLCETPKPRAIYAYKFNQFNCENMKSKISLMLNLEGNM